MINMRASINLRNRNVEDEYGDFELDSASACIRAKKQNKGNTYKITSLS